jgi:hypothetical protein
MLAILLAVLFVATLTGSAISAVGTNHSNKGLQTFNTEQLAKQH